MSNKDLAELERLLHLYQQERNANRVNTTISTSQTNDPHSLSFWDLFKGCKSFRMDVSVILLQICNLLLSIAVFGRMIIDNFFR